MEESPPGGDNMSSDSSEESDSDKGTPRHRHSDSVSQVEEEGEELIEDPTEELAEEPTEELAEEPTEELAGEPATEPTEGPTKETTVECPTLGEGHHSGASEKLKKEWLFTCQKKRLTTCVEDPVSTETSIQEDYKGDGHGHLWLCKTSTCG